jgi:hypothetical protein
VENRDYKCRRYKEWRRDVRKRDKWRCRWPGCKVKGKYSGKLQVHHIKRWEDFPTLRFVVSNGITLCTEHHKRVWGKERDFEQLFMQLTLDTKQRDAFLQSKIKSRLR